jgi:hypothetical protein
MKSERENILCNTFRLYAGFRGLIESVFERE